MLIAVVENKTAAVESGSVRIAGLLTPSVAEVTQLYAVEHLDCEIVGTFAEKEILPLCFVVDAWIRTDDECIADVGTDEEDSGPDPVDFLKIEQDYSCSLADLLPVVADAELFHLLLLCSQIAVHPELVSADVQVSGVDLVSVNVIVPDELSDTARRMKQVAAVDQGFGPAVAAVDQGLRHSEAAVDQVFANAVAAVDQGF